ncbi:MAG TPA: hypothetical protein VFV23_14750 [Verrucomicrobiae bacterium]|nr:hypothetical protein [Verrucomicrobiae bacterium]
MFPVIHLVVGILMVVMPDKLGGKDAPPEFIGWIFIVFASLFILAGWTFAAFVVVTGRFLARRKHHTFCFVMAAVECMFMPFGTVLGAFTLAVLMQEPVKQLFQTAE